MRGFHRLLSLAISLEILIVHAAVPVPLQRLRSAKPVSTAQVPSSLLPPAPMRVASAHHNESGPPLPHRDDLRVDGRKIPLLKAAVQDSFAGRVPISSVASDNRTLFFWYWPSSAKHGSDTLTIWLNGGPGCSSLTGFLTENGAFTFRPGEKAPSVNNYAWSTISDMLYVDQPVSTGFSSGISDIVNEYDVADQFYGFLKNLYTVFPELLSKKLYISGESYAGMYIPYIADRIVNASKAEKKAFPINLQSILINDPLWTSFVYLQLAPMADFVTAHQKTLGVNDSVVQALQTNSVNCGFQGLMDQLVYPPKGPISFDDGSLTEECFDGVNLAYEAAQDANPCYNIYRITDKCPTPDDPIEAYFSRADVQELLHVPNFGPWVTCGGSVFVNETDESAVSDYLFPELIKALPRGVTLWHGLDDMLLLANGTRLGIQDITWDGAQGFQKPIKTPIILDGVQHGLQHSERGFTYYEVANSGHMIPADQPKLALEVLKTVLGGGSLLHTNGGH